MEHQEKDFYQHLRSKIKTWIKTGEGKKYKWAEYIMFAPDLFHLLCKLSLDKDVPVKEKAKLVAAIAYFVSPIDLIPEMITGPVGYIDDIAINRKVGSDFLMHIHNDRGRVVITG